VDIDDQTAESYMTEHGSTAARPVKLHHMIGHAIHLSSAHWKSGCEGDVLRLFEECLEAILASQMAMNKITYTPLPFPYTHMLTVVNNIFVLSLPFVLVAKFGWWTMAIVVPFGVVVYSMQHIAELMEGALAK